MLEKSIGNFFIDHLRPNTPINIALQIHKYTMSNNAEGHPVAQTILRTHTNLPPCALRYHPSNPSLIFLGTYKLEDDGSRNGSVDIYENTGDELVLKSSTRTESAILDLKFSQFDDSVIYTGHSTGDLTVWKYDLENSTLQLLYHSQLFEKDVLITSIIVSQTTENRLLLTTTDGYASVVDITTSGVSEPRYFGTNHDLQCWTGAFGNYAELSNVVFTGGDDGSLIAHDLREPDSLSIFNAKRIHEAGVVAIQTSQPGNHSGVGEWMVDKPYNIWTGSYDDNLRTLDLRCVPESGLIQGLTPRVKEKLNLGGGVWRFQPSPIKNDNRLLTCCMYDGARILTVDEDKPKVERYFKDIHESMVYGCDWSPNGDEVATCSFYDSVLELWSPDRVIQ